MTTQDCREKHRTQADRHSITYDNDGSSLLTARQQKAGWMHLSVTLLPQSESSSLTDTEGQTSFVQLSRIQLWIFFFWFRLKLIVKSYSPSLCLGIHQQKKAQASRPLFRLRWADTFFNYAHEGGELEV